jgi:hypothetical protein
VEAQDPMAVALVEAQDSMAVAVAVAVVEE